MIDSTNVIVVHSLLNVLHIFMGLRHTHLEKLFSDLLLWVLELVLEGKIFGLNLLPKGLLSHITVDLGKLLHLKVMLSNQVLLLLGEISEVSSWGTGVDLSRWHGGALDELGSSCDYCKAFN